MPSSQAVEEQQEWKSANVSLDMQYIDAFQMNSLHLVNEIQVAG